MRRPAPGLVLALTLGGSFACDAAPWLRESGLRAIREGSVREGMRVAESPGVAPVQVRGAGAESTRVSGTARVAIRDPLARNLAGRAPVVVLADPSEDGLAAAARPSRAGIQEVVAVRGGVAAWLAARRPAGRRDATGLVSRPRSPGAFDRRFDLGATQGF